MAAAQAKKIDWDELPAGIRAAHTTLTQEQVLTYFEAVNALENASVRKTANLSEVITSTLATVQAYTSLALSLGAIEGAPIRIRYDDLEMDYLVPAPEEEGGKANEQETRQLQAV